MKLMRIKEMEDYILTNGTVSLDELCQVFNVSKNTVRRDINKLTEKGVIKNLVYRTSASREARQDLEGSYASREVFSLLLCICI